MRAQFIAALATVLPVLSSPPAHADAIDGNWCNPEGGNLEIQGPRIITPGGNQIAGDYDRHGFRYVIPADEPRAGANVDMVLVDDDTLHRVEAPGANAPIEVWRRCSAATS